MFKKILLKILRKPVIWNYHKFCSVKKGHALLYYKTDYFYLNGWLDDNRHTNSWEGFAIAKILNEMGYWVDIVDRTAGNLKLEDKYDLFFGAGAGDSFKHYADYAKQLTKAKRIFYALGMSPDVSVQNTVGRYELFKQRYPNSNMKQRRLVREIDIDESMKYTDLIITNNNDYGQLSYSRFNKPIKRVYLSSHPAIKTTPQELMSKKKCFLYFGGNGNIVKGLDLTIEAFARLPHLELFICSPKEDDFSQIFDPIIERLPNVHNVGFVDTRSDLFNDITDECAFAILPSCSESCATSVTTVMRKGLIPIVTKEAGVDVGDFGYIIEDINDIDKVLLEAYYSEDYKTRCLKSYQESFKYTRDNFIKTMKEALC